MKTQRCEKLAGIKETWSKFIIWRKLDWLQDSCFFGSGDYRNYPNLVRTEK